MGLKSPAHKMKHGKPGFKRGKQSPSSSPSTPLMGPPQLSSQNVQTPSSVSKSILKRRKPSSEMTDSEIKKRRSIQFVDKPLVKAISPRASKVRAMKPFINSEEHSSESSPESTRPRVKPKPNPKDRFKKQGFNKKGVSNTEKGPQKDFIKRQEAKVAEGAQQQVALTPREKRLQAKEMRQVRRSKKMTAELFDVSTQLKQIWEEIRPENTPRERVAIGLSRIVNAAEGKVKPLLLSHDTVRVLEFVVSHTDKGEPNPGGSSVASYNASTLRDRLFDEISSPKDILELATSKYASFFLTKMLSHGTPAQKETITKAFYGNVKKYLRHSIASKIIETIYNEVANAAKRSLLCQEYYGPQFTLFKSETATLDSLLGESSSLSRAQKASILDSMREELTKLTDKSVVKHSLVHFLLRQYFRFADLNSKREMIEQQLRHVIVEILHTKDGSRVGMECLRYGTPKDRKAILKSFKGVVGKIASEEEGHLVLLTALDTVDDTKLLGQLIIQELLTGKGTTEVTTTVRKLAATDKNVTKVCHYLLSPRDTHYFHPQINKILEESDLLTTVKKPRPIREQEIRKLASADLLNLVVDFAEDMLISPHGSILLSHILASVEVGSDRKPALKAVAAALAKYGPYVQSSSTDKTAKPKTSASPKADNHPDESNMHLIERNIAHRAFKKIFANDLLRQPIEAGKSAVKEEIAEAEVADSAQDATFVSFAQVLIEELKPETLLSYVQCNRGCYFLLDLCRSCKAGAGNGSDFVLKAKKELTNSLRMTDSSGAKLLQELFTSIK